MAEVSWQVAEQAEPPTWTATWRASSLLTLTSSLFLKSSLPCADPTAIEAEVRKQMAERAAAHEDRNLARKLTPAERRDKKLRKLLDDTSLEAQVAVYKVGGREE